MKENKELRPYVNESLEEYKYRICNGKEDLELEWKDICNLIDLHFKKKISRDNLRHEYYGMKKRDFIQEVKDENYTKVLVINDLHLPYEREDVLDIIKENKNVDYILIGGDLLDCKSCSFFDDFNKGSVEDELIYAHDFLSKVNAIINPNKTKIFALRGNHEERYTRDIMRMQEKQLQKLLNPYLLSMIEKGFTVYYENKDVTYKPIENFKYYDEFYLRLFNNLIITHPLDFSSVDGRIAEKVADYFLNEHIAEKDDVIIFGHTHKHSALKINRRQGLYVIENGCLCKPQKYSKRGKLNFTPQNYCYTLLKFKEGEKINLNDIKIVHLD